MKNKFIKFLIIATILFVAVGIIKSSLFWLIAISSLVLLYVSFKRLTKSKDKVKNKEWFILNKKKPWWFKAFCILLSN